MRIEAEKADIREKELEAMLFATVPADSDDEDELQHYKEGKDQQEVFSTIINANAN